MPPVAIYASDTGSSQEPALPIALHVRGPPLMHEGSVQSPVCRCRCAVLRGNAEDPRDPPHDQVSPDRPVRRTPDLHALEVPKGLAASDAPTGPDCPRIVSSFRQSIRPHSPCPDLAWPPPRHRAQTMNAGATPRTFQFQ